MWASSVLSTSFFGNLKLPYKIKCVDSNKTMLNLSDWQRSINLIMKHMGRTVGKQNQYI
jgi:hypothetical protein